MKYEARWSRPVHLGLAAASLAPQGVARFDHAGNAVAKRFVRLVGPYAVALLLTVVVAMPEDTAFGGATERMSSVHIRPWAT